MLLKWSLREIPQSKRIKVKGKSRQLTRGSTISLPPPPIRIRAAHKPIRGPCALIISLHAALFPAKRVYFIWSPKKSIPLRGYSGGCYIYIYIYICGEFPPPNLSRSVLSPGHLVWSPRSYPTPPSTNPGVTLFGGLPRGPPFYCVGRGGTP